MELKDFTEDERKVLSQAIYGNNFTTQIKYRTKLKKGKLEKTIKNLISKGAVSVLEKKTLFNKGVYKFIFGIYRDDLVNIEEKEKEEEKYRKKDNNSYDEEYEAMMLRSKICP